MNRKLAFATLVLSVLGLQAGIVRAGDFNIDDWLSRAKTTRIEATTYTPQVDKYDFLSKYSPS
jgi:hypothetical protein